MYLQVEGIGSSNIFASTCGEILTIPALFH